MHCYGEMNAGPLVLLLSGEEEREGITELLSFVKEKLGHEHFGLALIPVSDWNRELAPWEAPPAFGKEGFGNGAEAFLQKLVQDTIPMLSETYPCENRSYVLTGYSLAGFFALWAGTKTELFSGVAGVSPSVWYPGWLSYEEAHPIKSRKVYLSLGDREEKTRNPVLATVGDAIRTQYRTLSERGTETILEWNPGNHFVNSGERLAKGIAWLLKEA